MQGVDTKNWLKLILLALLWGASFMSMSVALKDAGPLFVVAARLSLGAFFLVTLSYARGVGLPARHGPGAGRTWLFILGMAFFTNTLPFSLLAWAQQIVPSGFAGVCMSIVPLITLPLAHFLVPNNRMTWRRTIGFAVGTVGVIVLIGPDALSGVVSGNTGLEVLARLACLGVATCYATGSILTRLAPETDRLSLAAAVLLVAAFLITPYALITEGWPASLGNKALWALIYLGIFPTGLAQVLLVQVIRDAGPVFMSLVNYQVPLWAVFFGSVLLAEPLPPSLFLALALILVGMAISQYGALTRLFGRR